MNRRMMCLLIAFLFLVSSTSVFAKGGGRVLSPNETPHGYSLTDMVSLIALFTTSGNNPAYYPNTPIQILHTGGGFGTGKLEDGGFVGFGGNTFTVEEGTYFFVPLFFVDDSPPILGTFPTNNDEAVDNFFQPKQIGARHMEIEVDCKKTSVGPNYLAGPVETPPLLDGGGTHAYQLGVFLSPLEVGIHTVTIRGEVAGPLWESAYGVSFVRSEITYLVLVVPSGQPAQDAASQALLKKVGILAR